MRRFAFRVLIAALIAVLNVNRIEAAGLDLFDGHSAPFVAFDKADKQPIKKAAQLLARDLRALTSRNIPLAADLGSLCRNGVLIGRADAPLVSTLLQQNHIDITPMAGKWEVYGRAVVPSPCNPAKRILMIFGSDTRGTIWGVIDLTREMGVSPWEWWADVKIRKSAKIVVRDTLQYSKEPTVKYRGIFLNDEDWGLQPWAAKNYEPKTHDIGPRTYARIFELMWRLKANTIWPAMHDVTKPFNQVLGNAEMADSYAIIHGTSHAEPMLRDNVREWDVKTRGEFNYLTNRDNMLAYWTEGVEQNRSFENIYTVGLRGIHDSAMEGVAGPAGAARVMQEVIVRQRDILQIQLGRPAEEIPQVLTPYKEVLSAYDAGLELPDDVTIVWPDDNHGYIRRLSNVRERARSGRAGIYYHLSYWGAPMSYLWLATTHPLLVWEEMDRARRFGADRLWIANVGDIKPAEYLTTLFLDMAFDPVTLATPGDVRDHLKRWMGSTFGEDHADELADIMWRYYDLAFVRKPEHMGWNELYPSSPMHPTAFNMLDFGDENARRMEAYLELSSRVAALKPAIRKDRQDAFFQLVQYPVQAAADFNERILDTDKAIAYGLQHRSSANLYAERAKKAQSRIVAATRYYNLVMSHGKWNHMMDLAPNRLVQFKPPAFPSWTGSGDRGCGIQAEGGQVYSVGEPEMPSLPTFQLGLLRSRYIDLFTKSAEKAAWSAIPTAPWIKLDKTRGGLGPQNPETRLKVSIDWSAAPPRADAAVLVSCGNSLNRVRVGVHVLPRPADPEVSFVEENRIVSIYGSHANKRSEGWDTLEGLGHTGTSLRSRLNMESQDLNKPGALQNAPRLEYVFSTMTANEPATLNIVALPTASIDSDHLLRLAVSIDDKEPVVVDLRAAEFTATWRQNVFSNTAIGKVRGLQLPPGKHRLTVWALDPGVIFERATVAFGGANRAYGPVPETRLRQ